MLLRALGAAGGLTRGASAERSARCAAPSCRKGSADADETLRGFMRLVASPTSHGRAKQLDAAASFGADRRVAWLRGCMSSGGAGAPAPE